MTMRRVANWRMKIFSLLIACRERTIFVVSNFDTGETQKQQSLQATSKAIRIAPLEFYDQQEVIHVLEKRTTQEALFTQRVPKSTGSLMSSVPVLSQTLALRDNKST